jgi:hypothetical protein
MYCHKPNHKEHECCKKKADETAAAKKERNDAEPTDEATAKVVHTQTMPERALSSYNEECIWLFTVQQ